MKLLKGPSKPGKTKLVTTEYAVIFSPAFASKYGFLSVIAYTQIPLWGVVLIAVSIGVAWEIIETARYVFFCIFLHNSYKIRRYHMYRYEGLQQGNPYVNMGKAALFKMLPCLKPLPDNEK
jgi:hypothetical protein